MEGGTVFSPVRKAIAAAITSLSGWGAAVTVSDPGPITAGEWVILGTALGTAFLVWLIPNEGT